MTWLQQRLNELNYTHADLVRALEQQGIDRVRGTISGWAKGNISITPLLNPEDAQRLATALDWTVSDMLIAAGYPILESDQEIPAELNTVIPMLRQLSKDERALVVEVLVYGTKVVDKLNNNNDVVLPGGSEE